MFSIREFRFNLTKQVILGGGRLKNTFNRERIESDFVSFFMSYLTAIVAYAKRK